MSPPAAPADSFCTHLVMIRASKQMFGAASVGDINTEDFLTSSLFFKKPQNLMLFNIFKSFRPGSSDVPAGASHPISISLHVKSEVNTVTGGTRR